MTERKCLNLIKRDWELIASNPNLMDGARKWYPIENEYCRGLAEKYDFALQQIAGLYSAFSPLKSVSENKKILENFLKGRRWGHTTQQIGKGELILTTTNPDEISVILGGLKTQNFFRNIYTPEDKNWTTVDRHILKYFNKGQMPWITPKRYTTYSTAIKKFANEVNMYPTEIQSALWLYSKEQYGNNV